MARAATPYRVDLVLRTTTLDRLQAAVVAACTPGVPAGDPLAGIALVDWPGDYPLRQVGYTDPNGLRLSEWWTAADVTFAREFVYAAYRYVSTGWAAVIGGVSYEQLEVSIWLVAMKVWKGLDNLVGSWSFDPLMDFNQTTYDVGGGNLISFPVDPAAGTTDLPGFLTWYDSGGQSVTEIVPLPG